MSASATASVVLVRDYHGEHCIGLWDASADLIARAQPSSRRPRRMGMSTGTEQNAHSAAIPFTGGVGEGSAMIRRRAAERLAYLGVAVAIHHNDHVRDDRDITAATGTVRAW